MTEIQNQPVSIDRDGNAIVVNVRTDQPGIYDTELGPINLANIVLTDTKRRVDIGQPCPSDLLKSTRRRRSHQLEERRVTLKVGDVGEQQLRMEADASWLVVKYLGNEK